MSAEQYRLLFASGNAHLSNVVFDAFVTAGRGRVEARLVSALAQARVFATRAPCDIVLLDATLGADLLETMQEIRRERADLLIAVLAQTPTGSQRATYLSAGARLIVAPPSSLEETEALLVQVISALHALRQPVAPPPAPVPVPTPAPVVAPPPAQTPLVQRRDAPLFQAPSPAATPVPPSAPAPARDGMLFQAPTPSAPPAPTPQTPQVRRSDAPLFPREAGAPPVTSPSIRPAAIRLAQSQAGAGPLPSPTPTPAAAKLTGTRTIALPVARPAQADPVAALAFAPEAEAPEPPPAPEPAPEPPPVAPPAPVEPPAAQERPRTSNFRFTQLIKNIKPVSLPPKPGGDGTA